MAVQARPIDFLRAPAMSDMPAKPSFFARLGLALSAPFRLLFDGEFAARMVSSDAEPAALPQAPPETPPEAPPAAVSGERPTDAALQLLAILQREGRLLDFLSESVSGFTDADIGAAARVVHAGCRKAVDDYFEITPLRSEEEGANIELAVGYDAAEIRVTGNVIGDPPYSGTLAHHGWRVTQLRLPELTSGHDPSIIAPAEVEL